MEGEKTKIEEEINLGISKWKEATEQKEQLRELYRQLNSISNFLNHLDREEKASRLEIFR